MVFKCTAVCMKAMSCAGKGNAEAVFWMVDEDGSLSKFGARALASIRKFGLGEKEDEAGDGRDPVPMSDEICALVSCPKFLSMHSWFFELDKPTIFLQFGCCSNLCVPE
jgi:hypothetical protein